MQINKVNTNSNFGAGFSSVFNEELNKLRTRIFTTNGRASEEMNRFIENIPVLHQKFRDCRIVISKKGQKGTFLEQNGKRIAQLSVKYKKFNLDDIDNIAHTLEHIV